MSEESHIPKAFEVDAPVIFEVRQKYVTGYIRSWEVIYTHEDEIFGIQYIIEYDAGYYHRYEHTLLHCLKDVLDDALTRLSEI